VGGLAIAVVGGWIVPRKVFLDELRKGRDEAPSWHGRVVYLLVRLVAPVLIALILLNSLGVITLA
jgi:neurotransmitter:Na+ symporter, NSS family